MDKDKILFLPSVQHTGTWFVLSILKKFGYNIVDSKRLLEDGMRIDNPSTIQTHFPIESIDGKPFELDKWMSVNSIQALSKIFQTVIPIRDPLAAILTREARHPELRHFYIVDGFVDIVEKMAKNSSVLFFPIDLPDLLKRRLERAGEGQDVIDSQFLNIKKQLVINTLNHCGIEIQENIIDEIANSWIPENITPNNRFKKAYDGGDRTLLEILLGSKMAEVNYLQNKASIILPFMSNLGYNKGDLDLW